MAEYIERGALIDTIEGTDWYHVSPRGFLVHGAISDGNALYKADDIFKALKDAPTADVAEVVHCVDCEYLMFSDMYGECRKAHLGIVSPHDFCSRGQRKRKG